MTEQAQRAAVTRYYEDRIAAAQEVVEHLQLMLRTLVCLDADGVDLEYRELTPPPSTQETP